MKKHTKKLTLNKKTVSNLSSIEMNRAVGGWATGTCLRSCVFDGTCRRCGGTGNGNTCRVHNTCYTC